MTIFLSLAGFIYTFALTIIFFRKKTIKSKEITLYKLILILTNISLAVELMISFFVFIVPNAVVRDIFIKTFINIILIWTSIFCVYVYSLSHKEKNTTKRNKIMLGIYVLINFILFLLVLINPVYYNTIGYAYGPGIDLLFTISGVYTFLIVLMLILDVKNIKRKGYIPVVILIIAMIITSIIQKINPSMLLVNFMYSLVTFIMFHTIENPDMKMIQQLDAAKAAAEKANHAKSDFLSSMSHEIRTPLNAIVGFSDCILEEDNIEDIKQDAKDIKLASQNLLEIVNGILDISKIEADKMEIVETNYELRDTLDNVAKLVKPRIGEKPIEFICSYAPDLPYMCFGDGGKLRQIVTNILTNAVKYTEEGKITYSVGCINHEDKCDLIISVEDTGRGIKPDQIDKLFNKFQRLDEDKNTTLEGTGLGLAITKRLAEMMGGKVVVQSVYGQGSKFTVYLSQKIVEREHTEETLLKDLNKLNQQNKDTDFSNMKIAVVDDNKINLKVAAKLLSQYGITSELIESGFDLIEKLKTEKYDLVLLDDMMPKMSGVETLAKIKEENPNISIPFVALTANAITGMKEKYLEAGFNDYLSKPIDKGELERVLKEYTN